MRHCSLLLLLALTLLTSTAPAQEGAPLRLVQTIPLPHVEGRMDHMAVDLHGQRLFVAALGNNTLEVLDVQAGTHLHTITGLHEPQGVVFLPESNTIVVTNGQTGACDLFDGTAFQHRGAVTLASDADNVRYDAATHTLYVGYGAGALGLIDATRAQHFGDIPLTGHPEAFHLEQAGPRIFVNVPSAHHVAVVDRDTRAVITTWPLQGAEANFPMALDDTHHRLFVGVRTPPLLLVLDTESGKEMARVPSVGDADDLFYDAPHRRLYIAGGAGSLSIVAQEDAVHYTPVATLPTAVGARTALWVPALGRLYLAVPHRGAQGAEIRVYASHSTPHGAARAGALVLVLLGLLASSAWGYRPFVSTDAAVVERARMEIELGYLTFVRAQGGNTFMIPQVVLNYGLTPTLELVGEFKGEEAPGTALQLVDPALSLKAVLREGILQEKAGVSIAVEAGLLLPATVPGEQRLGFEGVGIVSLRLAPFTFHLNVGGGVDREETRPFGVWGVITELPLGATVRLVGEINGESGHGHAANNSGLLGVLWQPPWLKAVIDAGVRRGFSRGAPDWLFTTGVTLSFPLPGSGHQ